MVDERLGFLDGHCVDLGVFVFGVGVCVGIDRGNLRQGWEVEDFQVREIELGCWCSYVLMLQMAVADCGCLEGNEALYTT